VVSIEEKKQRREQDRADAFGLLVLFAGAIAIAIGLFVGPSTLAACIASAWGLYGLGLISMESETAREIRGFLLAVTITFCVFGALGYFTIGTFKADEAMASAGLFYFAATAVLVVISRVSR
jgi:uncharacterized membrane protein YiaA